VGKASEEKRSNRQKLKHPKNLVYNLGTQFSQWCGIYKVGLLLNPNGEKMYSKLTEFSCERSISIRGLGFDDSTL
jgi:hypothetical protein